MTHLNTGVAAKLLMVKRTGESAKETLSVPLGDTAASRTGVGAGNLIGAGIESIETLGAK